MIESRNIQKIRTGTHTAAFRIIGAKIYIPDPGLNDRPGTHRTRFKGNIKITIIEPPRTELSARFGDRLHFGMSRRLLLRFAAVASRAMMRSL